MDTTSLPGSQPGNPNGVNVTVNVNTTPSASPQKITPSVPRFLVYAVVGLLAIGFIAGQLVIGGVVTFTLP